MADLMHQVLFSDSDKDDFRNTRITFVRKNFLELFDESEFKKRFRVNKVSAFNIVQEIEDIIQYPSDRYLAYYFCFLNWVNNHLLNSKHTDRFNFILMNLCSFF